MVALVAPGQGAQRPEMLCPWVEVPGVTELLEAFSEAAGRDLVRLGTRAGAEEIGWFTRAGYGSAPVRRDSYVAR